MIKLSKYLILILIATGCNKKPAIPKPQPIPVKPNPVTIVPVSNLVPTHYSVDVTYLQYYDPYNRMVGFEKKQKNLHNTDYTNIPNYGVTFLSDTSMITNSGGQKDTLYFEPVKVAQGHYTLNLRSRWFGFFCPLSFGIDMRVSTNQVIFVQVVYGFYNDFDYGRNESVGTFTWNCSY